MTEPTAPPADRCDLCYGQGGQYVESLVWDDEMWIPCPDCAAGLGSGSGTAGDAR